MLGRLFSRLVTKKCKDHEVEKVDTVSLVDVVRGVGTDMGIVMSPEAVDTTIRYLKCYSDYVDEYSDELDVKICTKCGEVFIITYGTKDIRGEIYNRLTAMRARIKEKSKALELYDEYKKTNGGRIV